MRRAGTVIRVSGGNATPSCSRTEAGEGDIKTRRVTFQHIVWHARSYRAYASAPTGAVIAQDSDRLRLGNSLEGSASWIYPSEGGSLRIEFYDFGEKAQTAIGNDVAFLVSVARHDKERLLETPAPSDVEEMGSLDDTLLHRVAERFGSYFAVTAWLDEHDIPYKHTVEAWA